MPAIFALQFTPLDLAIVANLVQSSRRVAFEQVLDNSNASIFYYVTT